MPGSTTPNSTSSLATAKDLTSFIDILKTYKIFYENNFEKLLDPKEK
jgi:phage anti-repressor protein